MNTAYLPTVPEVMSIAPEAEPPTATPPVELARTLCAAAATDDSDRGAE